MAPAFALALGTQTYLGAQLLPLLESNPILLSQSTTYVAGLFLQSVFPLLEAQEKSSVERAILALPAHESDVGPDAIRRESARNRLLACLPIELVGAEEAKRFLEQMTITEGVHANESPFRMSFEYTAVSEREVWERSGVAYESVDAMGYRRLVKPVTEFVQKYRNETPPRDGIERVLLSVREVTDFLWGGASGQPPAGLMSIALDSLAECVEIVRRTDHDIDNEEFVALARDILIRARRDELPLSSNVDSVQFDQFPTWGSPSPRIVAARGLLLMSRDHRTYSDEVRDAIQHLSHDPVPAVRYMIAYFLHNLGCVEPELMWRLIDEFAREDPSSAVRFALASGTVERVLARDTVDRVFEIVDAILQGTPVTSRDRNHDPRKQSLAILLRIYLTLDHLGCREILSLIARDPENHTAELVYLCGNLRNVLDERFRAGADAGAVAAIDRAWAWLNEVCQAAAHALQRIRARFNASPEACACMEEAYKAVAWLVDSATMGIYFASGAR